MEKKKRGKSDALSLTECGRGLPAPTLPWGDCGRSCLREALPTESWVPGRARAGTWATEGWEHRSMFDVEWEFQRNEEYPHSGRERSLALAKKPRGWYKIYCRYSGWKYTLEQGPAQACELAQVPQLTWSHFWVRITSSSLICWLTVCGNVVRATWVWMGQDVADV